MKKSVLIILRRAYLEITHNHCAAKLIEYFNHWRNWKLKNHRTEWIYMPVRQIYEDLMGEHSVGIIRSSITLLIKLGILEQRHNPGNGQDRTWQYKLNLGVLQSLVNRNEQAEVKSDSPMVKSDQCSTQDQSTNIKSTEQLDKKETFPQEDAQTEALVSKYYEQLKFWQVYPLIWKDESLIKNPRFEPILQALTKIPRSCAERAIQAFLKWIKDARNVENKYRALEIAIAKRWD